MKTNQKIQAHKIMGIIVLMILSVSNYVNANAIVKGRVTNLQDEPQEYATATLICPETMKIVEGDMCNNKGEFVIENVEPGEYILSVRKLGYEKEETKRVSISDNNEIQEINKVVLNESNILLNEVEVIAAKENRQMVDNL